MTDWIPGPPREEPDDVPRAPDPARPDPLDLPPDLPRSPSGRVPQWVLDEAVGRPVEPVPFRAWPSTSPGPSAYARRSRRAGATAVVAVALVAALGAGSLWWLRGTAGEALSGSAAPTRTGTTSPATPSAQATPSSSDPGTYETRTGAPAEGVGETARPADLPLGNLRQPATRGYVFVARQKDKKTGITWSPCRPIRWVLRGTAHAPADGMRLLDEAFDRLGQDTGLAFEYDGTTKEKYADNRRAYQPRRYGKVWAPVLVSWSTTSEDVGLEGDVVGRAGPQWVVTDSGDRTYVSGSVSLDAMQLEQVRSGYGQAVARSIVMHELGHLVGLAHVSNRSSLMYPRSDPRLTDFSDVDRKGLRALGQGPCQPDV